MGWGKKENPYSLISTVLKKEVFMKKSVVKRVFAGVAILAVCAMFLALQPTPTKFQVGTFDSRAVAIAYARSALAAPVMKDWRDKYEKAKAEKNEEIIKECEAWGTTHQQLLHLQGFSIGSVAEILEKVKDHLPEAAQEAGVDIIVSKWEVAYKNPSIETVDLTSHLVKLFNPDENTLKILEELAKQPPLPLLEVLQMKEGE
jgi:Skp family chaperone for outer membrane proteins